MAVRIELYDIDVAKDLLQEFFALFGSSVSMKTVGEIEVKQASDRALLQILDAVVRHLGESRASTARLWVDERPYMLEPKEVLAS
jgi:hypothetical protein